MKIKIYCFSCYFFLMTFVFMALRLSTTHVFLAPGTLLSATVTGDTLKKPVLLHANGFYFPITLHIKKSP